MGGQPKWGGRKNWKEMEIVTDKERCRRHCTLHSGRHTELINSLSHSSVSLMGITNYLSMTIVIVTNVYQHLSCWIRLVAGAE